MQRVESVNLAGARASKAFVPENIYGLLLQKLRSNTTTAANANIVQVWYMAAGIKIFGADGYEAVASKIRDNLHGRGVIDPVLRNKVTHDIHNESLPYLTGFEL